jgi:hypothetical protein
MECLSNLVGLDGCTTGNEPYKLNQIGLSLKQLEELLPDGYQNVNAWLDAVKKLAADELSRDVVNKVASSVHVETLLENDVVGWFQKNRQETTSSNFAGIFFDIWNRTAYAKLKISQIHFYGNHNGDIEFKFVDLLTGKELDTVTLTAVEDEVVSVPVDVEVKTAMRSLKVGVIYDASSVTSYKTTMSKSGCSSCGGSIGYRSRIASIQPFEIEAPFIDANISSRNDTAGLSIDYAFACDQHEWICSISGMIALAYLYKVGYQLLTGSLNSGSQWSDQMTTQRKMNEERTMFFEGKYAAEMEKFLKHARVPDNVCFTCNSAVGVINRLPG